ncbi:MAG: hypothetical protein KZQ83_08775 [gamma proteobacterium symbiont of Taylorina sp.]|nr:hypothetical protein [gamma proteobacterium symbiont of Taylorina sp.]
MKDTHMFSRKYEPIENLPEKTAYGSQMELVWLIGSDELEKSFVRGNCSDHLRIILIETLERSNIFEKEELIIKLIEYKTKAESDTKKQELTDKYLHKSPKKVGSNTKEQELIDKYLYKSPKTLQQIINVIKNDDETDKKKLIKLSKFGVWEKHALEVFESWHKEEMSALKQQFTERFPDCDQEKIEAYCNFKIDTLDSCKEYPGTCKKYPECFKLKANLNGWHINNNSFVDARNLFSLKFKEIILGFSEQEYDAYMESIEERNLKWIHYKPECFYTGDINDMKALDAKMVLDAIHKVKKADSSRLAIESIHLGIEIAKAHTLPFEQEFIALKEKSSLGGKGFNKFDRNNKINEIYHKEIHGKNLAYWLKKMKKNEQVKYFAKEWLKSVENKEEIELLNEIINIKDENLIGRHAK